MTTSNVDWERFEHVLESLGVLARLTENKKLTLREGDLDIDNDKKFQFLLRWWHADDHDGCLENVRQTVNEAIHMARASLNELMYINGNDDESRKQVTYIEKQRALRRFGRLTEALECATHGIETQKVTYKNDDQFCARVDVLVGNMRDELHDMDMSLKLVANLAPEAKPTQAPPVATQPHPFATPAPAVPSSPVVAVSSDDESINIF